MMTERRAFEGKVVVVTGASSGIGRATLLSFAGHGASVVAVGRDEQALGAVVAEAAQAGADAHGVAVDVTSADGPRRAIAEAVERFGGLDVLVNAAGVIASAAIEATGDDLWDRLMDVNARAPFRLMREAFPHLKARGGNVVNVSSVNGLRSFPGVTAYCVSKAAVDHLTRCSALDWAPHGIRVNAVNPGVTVTNLHRRGGMDDARYADFLERAKTTHPLGRPGQPRDIAEMILFLASDRAGWITGETIAIDGGRHLTCAR
jgi:NAD(P)-dependent dehydrogenase (short-subunit alcohol dehydrogenase family)